MVSGISTMFLFEYPNELSDRLRLPKQEKLAGNDSNIINEVSVAIVDKLLEYKGISTKQHKVLPVKYLN